MKFNSKIKRFLIFFLIIIIIFLLIDDISLRIGRIFYPLEYEEIIIENSKNYQVDPYLVAAIIFAESRFSPEVTSHKGARGLMQLMPDTALWLAQRYKDEEITPEQLFDPQLNIKYGVRYLAFLYDRFDNNTVKVLAAYNAGHGKVSRWLRDKRWDGELENILMVPYYETRIYVQRVLRAYEHYQRFYDLKVD